MERCRLLVLIVGLHLSGCGGERPLPHASEYRTSPLGFSATLTEEDAGDLVSAGRDYQAIVSVLARASPGPAWTKVLAKLILERNEAFRAEIEAKNGPAGVEIDVWGARRQDGDVLTGLEWFRSDIEKSLLPDSWQKKIEQDRAATTIAVFWNVKSGHHRNDPHP